MKPWKRIEPTKVDKIGWRTIVTKTFKMPDGRIAAFQTLNRENSHNVATIALTSDLKIIVARQFRPGPERFFDELPGGMAEENDYNFEAAARRELLEETGYEAGTMQLLGDVYVTAYHNSTWHYFIARDCTLNQKGQMLDDNEHVEVQLISVNSFLDNARSGQMTDATAVLLAYEQLSQLKESVV